MATIIGAARLAARLLRPTSHLASVRRLGTINTLSTIRKSFPDLKGITGRAVLSSLRSVGLGIRTQDFYRLFTSFKQAGVMGAKQVLRDYNVLIPDSLMPVAPFKTRREYHYVVKVQAADYTTGKWGPKMFTLSSDKSFAPNDVLDQFYAQNEGEFDAEEVDWATLSFVRAYKRGVGF